MSQEHVELFMHYREVCNLYEAHYGDPDYFGDRIETGMRLTKLLAAIPSAEALELMIRNAQFARIFLVAAGSHVMAEGLQKELIDPLKELKEALYGKGTCKTVVGA